MTKENSEITGVSRSKFRVKDKVEMYMVSLSLYASYQCRSVANVNYFPPDPLAVGEVLIMRWPKESGNSIYDYSVWVKDADFRVAFDKGMELIEAARIREEELKGE